MNDVELLLRRELTRIASAAAPQPLVADRLIRRGTRLRRRRRALTAVAAAVLLSFGLAGRQLSGTPSTVRLPAGPHGIQLAAARTGALSTYVYSHRRSTSCTAAGQVIYADVNEETVTVNHNDFHQVVERKRTDIPMDAGPGRIERFRVNGYLYTQGHDLRQAGPETHPPDPKSWRRIASPATADAMSWGRSTQRIVEALAGNRPVTPDSVHGTVTTYRFIIDAQARARLKALSEQALALVARMVGDGEVIISIDEDAGVVQRVDSYLTDPPYTADVIKDGRPAKGDPTTCTTIQTAKFTPLSAPPAITLPRGAEHAITDPGSLGFKGGEVS